MPGEGVERRKSQRFKFEFPVTISVLSFDPGEQVRAVIIDLSRSGLGIISPRLLPAGARVEARWPGTAAFGEVIHSTEFGEDLFLAGLAVTDWLHAGTLTPGSHLDVPTLALFLAGILSGENMRVASDHINACASCKESLIVVEDSMAN